MKLLLATPAYGGMVTTQYLGGMIDTVSGLLQENIDFSTYILSQESLIQRARDKCAQYAIDNGFTHLMFIDADVGWKYPQLRHLIMSDKLVVGGSYPLKAYPLTVNVNVLDEHKTLSPRKDRTLLTKLAMMANPQGEVKVKHIPTGFLLIQTRVFEMIRPHVQAYVTRDAIKQTEMDTYSYFPVRVHDGTLESEDWAFCSICRQAGIDIYFNTNCITSHTGGHTYNMGEY